MSKRNVVWLVVIVVVGVVGWVLGGWLVGLVAAVGALMISEALERGRRRRRIAASGGTAPSVRDVVTNRRRRPGGR